MITGNRIYALLHTAKIKVFNGCKQTTESEVHSIYYVSTQCKYLRKTVTEMKEK